MDVALAYNVGRRVRFEWYRLLARSGRVPGLDLTPPGLVGARPSMRVHPGGSLRIGARLVTGDGVEISAHGAVTVGDDVFFNGGSRVVCHERITIGDHLRIAQGVTILDHDHATELRDGRLRISDERFETAPITIGSGVVLGDKVTVLKGVTIGDNVVVGANSVVTRDIPSGCVAVGAPARVVRTLDDD
jgi:acetyltransferase-like isoleucine patch superfamily enzyme